MSRSISISADAYVGHVDVDVDIDLDEIIEQLDDDGRHELAQKLGGICPRWEGEGDAARAETLIERAYLAARRMGDLPRELADLFWHVHGRAI